MLESSSQPPNYLISPTTPPPSPPPAPPPIKPNQFFSLISSRPSLRVTSEFDSDSRFFQKVKRQISEPLLALTSKHLSIHKDPQEQNALIKSSFDVGPKLHFKVAHDVKPKATIRFLTGEVTLEEKEEEEEEVSRKLLINGILKGPILNGVGAAHYTDKELKLRYSYKHFTDVECCIISIQGRFTLSDKLSYWYNFSSNGWSAVYKHMYDRDFKFKAGYDSEVRLGWASLWTTMTFVLSWRRKRKGKNGPSENESPVYAPGSTR
ncbi:Chloroplast outer envelope protein 37, putative isoform 2 [Hibiscus syriacus]|uniref:Chloroplast outer envelope protein 37, putative isoform 2 n=1 Tax=Hibiscus syriacus TaxID=106335 RepID=A0A6A2XGY5_HIBSY|nr:Chloroplast outer envelope protein 37, putative isoform 2 [Hibiscus syriacus]